MTLPAHVLLPARCSSRLLPIALAVAIGGACGVDEPLGLDVEDPGVPVDAPGDGALGARDPVDASLVEAGTDTAFAAMDAPAPEASDAEPDVTSGDATVEERCFPVGTTCSGPDFACRCGSGRNWSCSAPAPPSGVLPQHPVDFLAPCTGEGSSCIAFGPCSPRCECVSGSWQCSFEPACVVPSCPIVGPRTGQPCEGRLGQLCHYQAGSGGVAICVCEPLDGAGSAVWTCAVHG